MLLLNKKNIFMFYLLYNWALDIFPKFFRTQSRVQLFVILFLLPFFVAGVGVVVGKC